MKNKKNKKILDEINESLNEILVHLENLIYPEDTFSGSPPFYLQPHLQGEASLLINDEVLFVANNGRNIHGFVSSINDDLIEINQLDIFDNPTGKIFRFNKKISPPFLKRVVNYGI